MYDFVPRLGHAQLSSLKKAHVTAFTNQPSRLERLPMGSNSEAFLAWPKNKLQSTSLAFVIECTRNVEEGSSHLLRIAARKNPI
jgi:hypothetical protein